MTYILSKFWVASFCMCSLLILRIFSIKKKLVGVYINTEKKTELPSKRTFNSLVPITVSPMCLFFF